MNSPDLKKILMVEDDPDIQTVAQFALEAVGQFNVRVCGDGRTALEECATFSPDLVLLDVMMPDMDGPSVLRALRANSQLAHTPIVFMTAKVQPQEIAHYKELGALDVITKPFDPMTLADSVSKIWEQAYAQYPI
jgi:two-component system OmpR family response regulator